MKEFENGPPRQIVGIVGDVRHVGLTSDPGMDLRMYVPQAQLSDAQNSFLLRGGPLAWGIRTQGDPHGLVPVIQDQLRRTTGLPVSDLLSMDQVVSLSTGHGGHLSTGKATARAVGDGSNGEKRDASHLYVPLPLFLPEKHVRGVFGVDKRR
jgi:hypothetical protein